MGDTFSRLFGDDDEQQGSGAYDRLFGGGDSPPPVEADQGDVQQLASQMSPQDAVGILQQTPETRGILETLLNGRAQRQYDSMVHQVGESGVKYETPHASDIYLAAAGPAPAKIGKGVLGWLASRGADAAAQGGMGALQGGIDAVRDGASPKEMLKRVAESGGIGAGVELALSSLGSLGRGVGQLGDYLGGKARNVVAGGTKKEAQAILDQHGAPESIDDMLGALLERNSRSPWYGRSSGGYLKDIQGQLADEGVHHRDLMARASEEGIDDLIPDAWANVQNRTAADATERGARAIGDSQRQEAGAYQRVAEDIGQLPPPSGLGGFVADKSGQQAAGRGNDVFRTIGDSASDAASANAGRIMRDELDQTMDYALPETADAWRESRDKYRDLSMLQDLLKSKTAAEQSGGDFGNAISGALLGGGAGIVGSALTPGDDTGYLGAGGAIAGLATGTRSALRQAAGSWGADLGANMLKGGGALARGAGALLDRAPTGALAAEGVSRGHESTSVVESALERSPQILGPYAQRLAQAKQNDELTEEIGRLQDSDEQFRAMMRRLTGGGR